MKSRLFFASNLVATIGLSTIQSCRQAEPLIGPKESGTNPIQMFESSSACEEIANLSKTFTMKAPLGRKASYAGDINGFGYSSEYVLEFGGCDDDACHDKMYTKDSAGNLKEVHDEKLNMNREQLIANCKSLGMNLVSTDQYTKTVTVPAGTFKTECLRTSISMSFGAKDSQPYPTSPGTNDSLTSITVTEYCISTETDSAGIPVQIAQRILGQYDQKDTDPTKVQVSPTTRLNKILN